VGTLVRFGTVTPVADGSGCDDWLEMQGRDLGLLSAEWEANVVAREAVPGIACELLAEGVDSPSLRVAAGLLPGELDDAHEVLGRALRELGLSVGGDAHGQGASLAREYATRALDGRMPPVRAASAIAALSLQFDTEVWALKGDALSAFELLTVTWIGKPEHHHALEVELRAELAALLDRLGT
jgi:hypothetical protein